LKSAAVSLISDKGIFKLPLSKLREIFLLVQEGIMWSSTLFCGILSVIGKARYFHCVIFFKHIPRNNLTPAVKTEEHGIHFSDSFLN